jgi:transposase
MDLPAKYGSYKTCWDRFKKWSVRGVWSKILEALIAIGYSTGKLSLDKVAVDSITVKAGRGLVGYDGYWRVKVMKIHVAVTKESHKPCGWAWR